MLTRRASTSGYYASSSQTRVVEDKNIKGISIIIQREPEGNYFLKCWTCNELGYSSSQFPKRVNKFNPRNINKSRLPKNLFYANEDYEFDFKIIDFVTESDNEEDDEIEFVSVKEECPKKKKLEKNKRGKKKQQHKLKRKVWHDYRQWLFSSYDISYE